MNAALAADRARGEMLARLSLNGLVRDARRRTGHGLIRLGRRLPARIVFMGDSLTYQWSEADPFFFRFGWVNRGVGGQTSAEMRARFEAEVIAVRPRAVHIMAGTNDLWHGRPGEDAADAIANIAAMTGMARAAGIRVILAPPPPVSPAIEYRFGRADLLGRLHERVIDLAQAEGLILVDYADVLLGADGHLEPLFTTDGVHFTRAGYRAMRRPAERAIRAALKA